MTAIHNNELVHVLFENGAWVMRGNDGELR